MQSYYEPRKQRIKVTDKQGTIELHDGTQIAGRITISEDYASIHVQTGHGTSSYPSYHIKSIRWPSEAKA